MKIDRRCFLSLAVGGAIGTTFTPVPWKLMDDIAIWTQNWPWTPVPEDGPTSYKKSVCSLCDGGCGIQVRTVKGRAVKVEGQPDHPVNKGSLCPLGISATQSLYGPSRITSPMKRVGNRGAGQWEKITWDEAIAEVSKKMIELREQGKSHTVACISDSDRGTVPYLLDRFLTAYGSPNFIRTPSFMSTHELALSLTQGQQGTVGFDLENADYILSFGCALLDGWSTPGRMFAAYAGLDKKTKLVQVESRLSDTASRATQWVAAKPGTEGALALALGHVIVRDGLYDKDFVENFSSGFEDWEDEGGKRHQGYRSLVKTYSPEKVSDIAGIPKDRIVSMAHAFAKASRPIAISGRGRGMAPASLGETLAVHALNALVGNINKPGGLTAVSQADYLGFSEMKIDETASKGRQQARIDGAGTAQYPNARYLLNRIPEVINGAKGESPIQALLVCRANPLYTMTDPEGAQKAFDRIPFIVSFSSFMDETARHADLLLPDHHFMERYEDVPTPDGMPVRVLGLTRPVVDPQYDTRHVGDSIIQIAKKCGDFTENAFPWKNYEAFLKKTLSDQWKKLEKQGYFVEADASKESWLTAFKTPSTKYEFSPSAGNRASGTDKARLPGYQPVDPPGNEQQMPLILVPYVSTRLAPGPVANTPFMTKTLDTTTIKGNDVYVELNPKTAKENGLSEDDVAVLKTPKGEARVRIHLFEGIMPGLVAMPAGLGHTAFSDYIAAKGININALLADMVDPATGLNTAWGIRAALARA